MDTTEFDRFLRESLDDLLFSRAEKRTLRDLVASLDLDDRRRHELRHCAFEVAREYAKDRNSDTILVWLEKVIRALDPRETDEHRADAYFSPGEAPRNTILSLLRGARANIDICVFTITDNTISAAIEAAHKRGVNVRIVTDNHKAEDRGSDIDRLLKAGIPVFEDNTDKHMHHKFALFDRTTLLTGSYNWTRSAAEFNQENIVIGDDPRLVKPFVKEFERLVTRFDD